MLPIKDPTLLKTQSLIDNQWVDATDGTTIDVTNPFDNQVIATIPSLEKSQVIDAVAIAHKAQIDWAQKTANERAAILNNWADLIDQNKEDLATIMTAEQGKPITESRGEIGYAASFIEWFAEEAKRIYGDTIPGHAADKRIIVTREPVGVCAAITPWNFPAAMITRKVAPALAAGCTIVVKPAMETPLTALALAATKPRYSRRNYTACIYAGAKLTAIKPS